MIKTIVIILIFSLVVISFAQDEFAQEGTYTPNFFSELLDAEIYSPNVLYIVGVGGFIFVDISDISQPDFMGRYGPVSIFTRFYNGKAAGNLAIGAARLDGLFFINITNLSNPILYTDFNSGNFSYESVDFADFVAYGAIHENGIEVIGISTHSNPVSILTVGGLHNAWDVFIKDDYLYVADGAAGLKIFSLIDPINPELVGSVPTTGSAFEVIVENQYAYIALGSAGFDIIDVSDPTNPDFVSNFNPGFGILNHLNYSNSKIIAASWELVYAIDVSNPFDPIMLATEDTPVRAMGIAVNNDTVYVTDWARLNAYTFNDLTLPDIHVKPKQFDFGYPGPNVPFTKQFDVYNLGEATLNINDIYTNNDTYYSIQPTSLNIAPGESQQVAVTFSTSQPGNLNHALTFESDDPDELQINISLFGGRQRAAPGQPAREFNLQDINGNMHTLSKYLGKVVVFAVFASW
jgi:hypothetical protein